MGDLVPREKLAEWFDREQSRAEEATARAEKAEAEVAALKAERDRLWRILWCVAYSGEYHRVMASVISLFAFDKAKATILEEGAEHGSIIITALGEEKP